MNNSKKTMAVLTVDGQVLRRNPDGTYTPMASQTDWRRIENMSDEEVTAIARTDFDNPEWTEEDWENLSHRQNIQKKDIYLKVDEDILKWFKSYGRGYQSKINAVLRAFVERRKSKKSTN